MSDETKPTSAAAPAPAEVAAPAATASTDAATTETTAAAAAAAAPAASEGKGKGKAPQPAEDEDDDDEDDEDEDDDDEDDEDLDEVVEDFDGKDGLDPSNILPSRPRRAAAAKVTDYTSEDAIRKAGIAPEDASASKDDDEEGDASYMDTAEDN